MSKVKGLKFTAEAAITILHIDGFIKFAELMRSGTFRGGLDG